MGPSLLLIAATLLVAAWQPLRAQAPLDPHSLTNRRLALFNDASATGWNPALLGLQLDEQDILLAVSYDRDLALDHAFFGGFGRIGPVGAGYLAGVDDSVAGVPGRFYVGAGLPVVEHVFAGAGVNWMDGRGFSSAEWAVASLVRPMSSLMAGIAIGNVTGNNDASPWVDVHAAYAATTWLMLHGGLRFDERDTAGGYSTLAPSLGMGLHTVNRAIALSAQFEFDRGLRLGLEVSLGYVTGGTFTVLADGEFGGGVAIARWGSTGPAESSSAFPPEPRLNPLGWAPHRAFAPEGIDYTVPATNNDAVRNPSSLALPCTGNGSRRLDGSTALVAAVSEAGAPYERLARRLGELSADPALMIETIRRRVYTPPVRNQELRSGDSLALVSKQEHSITITSVDATRFPTVSVLMRVTDDAGRTVQGLGTGDFSFRDSLLQIVSVRPTDSTSSVPVDVVILVDCSGSMSDEIEAVRQNVERFVDLLSTRGANSRIGGVLYGSLIYDTLHPTSDVVAYKAFLKNASAIGGDEITTLALQTATTMNFRPDAQRLFVLITDDWVVQNNSRLDEAALVPMLWDTRARLYSVITPCRNNAAVATRLALGREYDIAQPFTSILDEIGNDISTIYELVYESRAKAEDVAPKITLLRGHIRDESGTPIGTTLLLGHGTEGGLRIVSNATTGEFEAEVTEGSAYDARIRADRYLPLDETVDLTRVQRGDTVTRVFVLRYRPTTIVGRVLDESGAPVDGEVHVADAATLQQLDTVRTRDGVYRIEVTSDRTYRLTPYVPNYIPFPGEVGSLPRGTEVVRDLNVTSIDAAIASGAVFPLKNLFFDYDKTDLKPESHAELDRLIGILREYPIIKVEVGAHTDARGTDQYNDALSARRAAAVVDYLTAQGVSPNRLHSRGYGERHPIASNDTDDGRALNRRVEFKLVK